VVGWSELLHPVVDVDVDRWLRLGRLQRAWRIRILEREILDVLGEHGELRLPLLSRARLRGRALRRAAIAGNRHHSSLSCVFPAKPAPDALLLLICAAAAVLTQRP